MLAGLEAVLLGGPRVLSLAQLAELVGTDVAAVRQYWHALGLPATDLDEVTFTVGDAEALGALSRTANRYRLVDRTAVSLIRSVGHTAERLAVWQLEALAEHIAVRYGLDGASARIAALDRLRDVHEDLELQLVHAWRRQMAALGARLVAEAPLDRGAGEPTERLSLARAVGFADIVSFTSRTARLGVHELAAFVQDYEARARDVVTDAGGRVVKTIGDAVLFVADDLQRGARVATGLADAFGADSRTPSRVSLVWGRVLARFGDVFGTTVNLAARLNEVGPAEGVIMDATSARLLAHDPEWVLDDPREVEVDGLGRVDTRRLRRAS